MQCFNIWTYGVERAIFFNFFDKSWFKLVFKMKLNLTTESA